MTFGASILPQPPSFKKKKSYVLHEELGAGTFGKVIRATWTKPIDGTSTPQPSTPKSAKFGKSTASVKTTSSSSPDLAPSSKGLTNAGSVSAENVKPGESRKVALKVISKKKVKGNEDAVWSEMNVLKGLDHPNIVRISFCYRDVA